MPIGCEDDYQKFMERLDLLIKKAEVIDEEIDWISDVIAKYEDATEPEIGPPNLWWRIRSKIECLISRILWMVEKC